MLNGDQIRQYHREGILRISPFCHDQIGPNTYDARLGPWFFRANKAIKYLDPFDEREVKSFWGSPVKATNYRIYLPPGETVLAHTVERVGGLGVVAEMNARSSVARLGLSICKCAGMGDDGYYNPWTMEISNHNINATIVLRVGMRICQFSFTPIVAQSQITGYYNGKYGSLLGERKPWTPWEMLPRMWQDWDREEVLYPSQHQPWWDLTTNLSLEATEGDTIK